MEDTLNKIDELFEEVLTKLQKHNEVFFFENEEDYGYFSPEGEEVNESDYQVYSDVDKHGFYNTYAIMKLENGVAHLIGLGENDNDKEILIDWLSIGELYELARLCKL